MRTIILGEETTFGPLFFQCVTVFALPSPFIPSFRETGRQVAPVWGALWISLVN